MKICIVGTGTMGHGIAQVFAQAGHEVLLKGRSEASLAKAHKAMDKNLSRMVEKGKLEAGVKDQVLARIKDTMKYEDCADADLVIEAIAEDMATKHEIFKLLDGICKPEAILATNTSSLSITEVAAVTNRPEKVIGMHFFNPVPAMKLVEVIKGRLTSAEVHDQVFALSQEIGKVPVSVEEAPGFIVNRILIPLVNEGIGILADGVAKKEEIDAAMKLGANHPMGPLELGDLIGLVFVWLLWKCCTGNSVTPNTGLILCCGKWFALTYWDGRPESGFMTIGNNEESLLYRDTMLGNISPTFLLFPHFLQAAILNLLYVMY